MPTEIMTPFIEKQSFTIASQVAFFRKRRGLSQAQLAALCKMKQPTIARLETTPDTQWRLRTIARICSALDCRVNANLMKTEDLK